MSYLLLTYKDRLVSQINASIHFSFDFMAFSMQTQTEFNVMSTVYLGRCCVYVTGLGNRNSWCVLT